MALWPRFSKSDRYWLTLNYPFYSSAFSAMISLPGPRTSNILCRELSTCAVPSCAGAVLNVNAATDAVSMGHTLAQWAETAQRPAAGAVWDKRKLEL